MEWILEVSGFRKSLPTLPILVHIYKIKIMMKIAIVVLFHLFCFLTVVYEGSDPLQRISDKPLIFCTINKWKKMEKIINYSISWERKVIVSQCHLEHTRHCGYTISTSWIWMWLVTFRLSIDVLESAQGKKQQTLDRGKV